MCRRSLFHLWKRQQAFSVSVLFALRSMSNFPAAVFEKQRACILRQLDFAAPPALLGSHKVAAEAKPLKTGAGSAVGSFKPPDSAVPPPLWLQVWHNDLQVSLLHSTSMRKYNWSYTQFSQFNADDSLLLVSGVFMGPRTSSSGEIAVISLGKEILQGRPLRAFWGWRASTTMGQSQQVLLRAP